MAIIKRHRKGMRKDLKRLVEAWASGKPYQKPTHFTVEKEVTGFRMHLYTDDVYLAAFKLNTRLEVREACGIVAYTMKPKAS